MVFQAETQIKMFILNCPQASIMVMIYGQIVDHDMMKTPEDVTVDECCPIENRDGFFSQFKLI